MLTFKEVAISVDTGLKSLGEGVDCGAQVRNI